MKEAKGYWPDHPRGRLLPTLGNLTNILSRNRGEFLKDFNLRKVVHCI